MRQRRLSSFATKNDRTNPFITEEDNTMYEQIEPLTLSKTNQEIWRHLTQNDIETAKKMIKTELQTNSESSYIWEMEAILRMMTQEWDAAEFACLQVSKFAPESIRNKLLWTRYRYEIKHFFKAFSTAKEAAELPSLHQQDRINVYLWIARCAIAFAKEDSSFDHQQIDESESFECLKEATLRMKEITHHLAPKHAKAWSHLGQIYSLEGDRSLALDAWKTAHSLDEEDIEILYGLAKAHEDNEEFESAHQTYTRLHQQEYSLYNQEHAPPLKFNETVFTEAAQHAWKEVKESGALEDIPFTIEFLSTVYPSKELVEESSPSALFDPRVGLHVDFVPAFFERGGITLVLFQRNIERDLEGNDTTNLSLAIQDLLELCLERIFAILTDENPA